jgi:hypothetical protein
VAAVPEVPVVYRREHGGAEYLMVRVEGDLARPDAVDGVRGEPAWCQYLSFAVSTGLSAVTERGFGVQAIRVVGLVHVAGLLVVPVR